MASRNSQRPFGPGPAASDSGLRPALRAGERAAAGELYRRHRTRVAAYLARRMVCPADVEDVVQDTFLRLWDSAAGDEVGEFDPTTHEFGAWLCGRVARHTLIDYRRKDRFRQLAALDIARDQARRQPAQTAHERETTPVSVRVVTAQARLTPAQRRSVQLRYLDGYSTAAAAIVAGCSPGAIATHCLAARARLRAELADLAPPAHPLAAGSKLAAVRAAFVAVGAPDVGAALEWLRERGIQVDPSYAYTIRNHHRGGPAADPDTSRAPIEEPQPDVDVGRGRLPQLEASRDVDEPRWPRPTEALHTDAPRGRWVA